jgi:hypothetical protein
MKLEIRKIDRLVRAAKVVALCLPPVAMSVRPDQRRRNW